jgi:hypothetical protein
MAEQAEWCFTWDPNDTAGAGKSRASLVNKYKWPKKGIINVAFLDGDPTVQKRIKDVVKAWTAPGAANLKIVFVNDVNKADVRISFKFQGSWSTIGTSCQSVTPKSRATMNYGWLTPSSTDQELKRVVLHEFGHALGLIHEHQNPSGGIPWNKDAVRRDLAGPPNNWDTATIDHNMFEAYSKDETSFTAVDTKSIMMYPIPKTWVTDPKFAVGLNSDLSKSDKDFVKKQYP